MIQPAVFVAVAVGAAGGGMLRYLLVIPFVTTAPAWPWATLLANALGSLVIGFVYGHAGLHRRLPVSWRVGIMTGFCGGLTTFSIFSLEVLLLWLDARAIAALAYLVCSVVVWLAMVWAGFGLGSRLDPTASR
ncbi:MAG: fluoride efflux transporter CrcB [Wenzhouxiangella sp.]|nr:MAG: fluoride efflux transporter CrcB [Wenzhouxiangella sp.]